MRRKNCWDIMKCGREQNGKNENLGICPAAKSGELDGKNHGEFGGRFCWNFAGTFCKGEVQGTVANKMRDCLACTFFMLVSKEEGLNFIFTTREAMKKNLHQPGSFS